jgi:hypothetical protein
MAALNEEISGKSQERHSDPEAGNTVLTPAASTEEAQIKIKQRGKG